MKKVLDNWSHVLFICLHSKVTNSNCVVKEILKNMKPEEIKFMQRHSAETNWIRNKIVKKEAMRSAKNASTDALEKMIETFVAKSSNKIEEIK